MNSTDKLLLRVLNELERLKNGTSALTSDRNDDDRFKDYAIYEVAKKLGRGEKWVKRMINEGYLKNRVYPGGEIRISHEELLRFVESTEQKQQKREAKTYVLEGSATAAAKAVIERMHRSMANGN